jgi:hypothetical protein
MACELTAGDRELLDRLARRVVELHMEVPAVLAIETGRPLSLLASQVLLFLEPIVQTIFSVTAYRRLALLIERREALEALAEAIERRAEAARAEKSDTLPPGIGAGTRPPARRSP